MHADARRRSHSSSGAVSAVCLAALSSALSSTALGSLSWRVRSAKRAPSSANLARCAW